MKKNLYFAIFTMTLLIIQRVWMEHFPILGSGPDLTLMVLIYFAAFHDPVKGVIVFFFVGALNDVLIGYYPGLYATIYVIIFFLMHNMGKSFFLRSMSFQVVAAMIVTVVFKLVEFLLLTFTEVPLATRIELWWTLPGQLITNTIAAPFIFKSLWFLEEITQPLLARRGAGWSRI